MLYAAGLRTIWRESSPGRMCGRASTSVAAAPCIVVAQELPHMENNAPSPAQPVEGPS